MTSNDPSISENSISIVDINPSDMTLTTSPNQNVLQVEAVMDVTIDIGKTTTLTLAEYLAGGNVNNGDSSQIQIVDVFQPGQRFSASPKDKSKNFFHDFRFFLTDASPLCGYVWLVLKLCVVG